MSDLVERAALEAVFGAEALITVPEEGLGAVAHEPTRAVLGRLGVPANFWLEASEGLRTGVWSAARERLREEFAEFGIDFDDWVLLGTISEDFIYLDVRTGGVYSIPDGGIPARLNTGLHTFVHFLYLLELERPNYDLYGDYEGAERDEDGTRVYEEGAEDRLRAQMLAVDPTGFTPPQETFGYDPGEATWELVLRFVAEKMQ